MDEQKLTAIEKNHPQAWRVFKALCHANRGASRMDALQIEARCYGAHFDAAVRRLRHADLVRLGAIDHVELTDIGQAWRDCM